MLTREDLELDARLRVVQALGHAAGERVAELSVAGRRDEGLQVALARVRLAVLEVGLPDVPVALLVEDEAVAEDLL